MQFTGKSAEEAVKKGLEELSLTEDDAQIVVLEEAVKGLFGRIKKEAVVEITVKEKKKEKPAKKEKAEKEEFSIDSANDTVGFVQAILDKLSFVAKATLKEEDPLTIEIIAENPAEVLGRKGESLDALQTLASARYNLNKKEYKKVVVDCENYRARREDTLVALAHRLEAKATETRREVILEPMSPFERRIIHTALSNSETVTTRSDGQEPNRYVVIVPNDKDEFSRPYNAGRNKGRNGDRDKKGGRNNFRGNGRNGRGNGRKPSGFTEERKKKPSGFGTYLGNSLKGE